MVDATTDTEAAAIPYKVVKPWLSYAALTDLNESFDSTTTIIRPEFRFALDERYEAYVLRMEDNWWVHKGFFVYDRQDQSIGGTAQLSQLIGGEGGQELFSSWAWSNKGNDLNQWIKHKMSRTTRWDEQTEDVIEEKQHWFWKMNWENNRLQIEYISPADTAGLAQRYPIDW